MVERLAETLALIALGMLAYAALLALQKRHANRLAPHAVPAGRPALLVFTSPTCAPCKLQQLPIVERLWRDWGDRLDLRVVDVVEQPEVAAQFGVWSLPTTIVLDASQRVVAINPGVAGPGRLVEQFRRVSGDSPAAL